MCHRRVLAVVLFLLLALVGAVDRADAQTNPCAPIPTTPVVLTTTSTYCVEVGADYELVYPGGQPAITEYAIEFYLKGATGPFYTVSIGKPAKGSDGTLRGTVPPPQGMARVLEHEARFVAVGPFGSTRSDPTNSFFSAGPPTAPRTAVIR